MSRPFVDSVIRSAFMDEQTGGISLGLFYAEMIRIEMTSDNTTK